MKNKWFICVFLLLLVIALCVLAMLQYRWIGSVSESEKERLNENLKAATENFATDFTREFEEMHDAFQIQVANTGEDYEIITANAFLRWKEQTRYPALIDSVFLLKKLNSEKEAYVYSVEGKKFKRTNVSVQIREWESLFTNKTEDGKIELSLVPNPLLGDKSLLVVPVQLIEMLNLKRQGQINPLNASLNINSMEGLIFIKLNNKIIREKVIQDKASVYFSSSFENQYQLSIINNSLGDSVYYSSFLNGSIPEPDFRASLFNKNFSSTMVFRTHAIKIDRLLENDLQSKKNNEVPSVAFTTRITDSSINTDNSNLSNLFLQTRHSDSVLELWLSFRDGSLEAYINKTRNRNLAVSFGILGILGISITLITLFSLRSKKLADQQMLFVAGVSHELRTPITVIRSAAENLEAGLIKKEKRRQEYARLLLKEGRRLSNMVEQIMEFSGIQSGNKIYIFQEIELGKLLDNIKEEAVSFLDEKNILLEYVFSSHKETIYADYDGLSIAIMNLIQNAAKFSPDESVIKFRIDDTKFEGNPAICFMVSDSGIGISESEQKKIFNPFYRGSRPVDDQVKGNGIGLSLVKKITEAHKGTIEVKSEQGKGSVFRIIIPLRNVNE